MADSQIPLKYSGEPFKYTVMQSRGPTHFLCSALDDYCNTKSSLPLQILWINLFKNGELEKPIQSWTLISFTYNTEAESVYRIQ